MTWMPQWAGRRARPVTVDGARRQVTDMLGVAVYARELLAFVSEEVKASSDTTDVFELPGMRVSVRDGTGLYHRMCRRSLAQVAPFPGDQGQIDIAVLGQSDTPNVPRLRWRTSTVSLGEIIGELEAAGLRGCYDADHHIWQVYDPHSGSGAQIGSGTLPPWEPAFPLRNFLHWGYEALGQRLIHAASLGRDGAGILLAGDGGSGKSGTTLAGILGGLQSVGDDYIVLDDTNGDPRARPVMRLVKQDAAGLRRLGLDADVSATGANWQSKHELDIGRLGTGLPARELAIRAIVLPTIASAPRSTFERVSRRDAMLALAPSTLRQLPGGWNSGLAMLAGLVRELPTWRLHLSGDASEICDAIGDFISRDAAALV